MSARHHLPWRAVAADRAVAAHLGAPSAFVPRGEALWFVRGGVRELALAVWERAPDQAHAVLRQRIRTAHPHDEVDRAAIAVLARRASFVEAEVGPIEVPLVDLAEDLARAHARIRAAQIDPRAATVPPDVRAFVAGLVPAPADLPRAERDRPVVAILADRGGRILAAARNAGGANRALHAELCLVLAYGPLADVTLYTSLQPCRLCAATIVAAARGPVAVRYLEPDPGRLARDTALQARGWEAPIGDR